MNVDCTGLQTLHSLPFTLYEDDDDDDLHIHNLLLLLLLLTVFSPISPLPIFPTSLGVRVGCSLDATACYFCSKTYTPALGTVLSPTHPVPAAVSLG